MEPTTGSISIQDSAYSIPLSSHDRVELSDESEGTQMTTRAHSVSAVFLCDLTTTFEPLSFLPVHTGENAFRVQLLVRKKRESNQI